MKSLILFLAVFATASLAGNWNGSWYVWGGCKAGCCCPKAGSYLHVTVQDNTTLIAKGNWTGNDDVCAKGGLEGQVILPWPATDWPTNPTNYEGTQGLSWVLQVGHTKNNRSNMAYVTVNELSIGGPFICEFTLLNGGILKTVMALLTIITFILIA